jgi:hypothetical protein
MGPFRRVMAAIPTLETPPSDFLDSFSETVWKIAEGFSSVRLWRQKAADEASFVPSWRASEYRFGNHSEFPNSFYMHSGE